MTETPDTDEPTAAGDDQHQVGNSAAKFFPPTDSDEQTSEGDVGGSGEDPQSKDDR